MEKILSTKGITVVVPIYNSEKYLEKCMKSLINQTYKDLEIILINDCSTDGSLKIIKKYQEIDKRIKLINLSQNQGQKKARNIGYENSKSEYITNVDSDDFLEEDAIEKNFKFMQKNNLDISIYDMYYYFENGDLKKQNKLKNKTIIDGKTAFIASINWEINSQGIYKRKIIERFRDDTNFFNGDEVAVRRRFLNSFKVGIGEGKYFYRQHSESYVHTINPKVYQYLISNLNLRKEIKKIKEKKFQKKALTKFEATNMSMLINFFKRYQKENFEENFKKEIEDIFRISLKEINKIEAFKYYIFRLKPFKFFEKLLKVKRIEKLLNKK